MKGKNALTLIVFAAITLPLIIHTQQLLVKVTPFQTEYRWLTHLYAAFFAVAFDLSVYHFAEQGKRRVSQVFAVLVFLINFMYWNEDIIFLKLPSGAAALDYSHLCIGTLFSGVSAYLVYTCSELLSAGRLAPGGGRKAKRQAPTAQIPDKFRDKAEISDKQQQIQFDSERVKRLAEAGFSQRKISEITELSRGTVQNYLKKKKEIQTV